MIKPLNNWKLKLMALLSAIVLWFFVVGVDNTIFALPDKVEIKVINLNPNISLANTIPSAKLYLKTEQNIFKNLTKNDFDVYLDLKDLDIGEHNVPVVVTPKNSLVTLLKVEPKFVDIKLTQITKKDVPIVLSYSGKLMSQHQIEKLESVTKRASINGSQALLDMVNNVNAELILDGTEVGDIEQNVTLKLPNLPNLNSDLIQIAPDIIKVTATIVGEQKKKIVKINPKIANVSQVTNWQKIIMLSSPTIEITGADDKLNSISSIDTKPFDPNLILSFPQPVEFDLPEGVTVNKKNQVTAGLNVGPDSIKQLSAPVVFTKQSSILKVAGATPDHINVTVTGSATAIKNLKPDSITVNFSLENVSSAAPIAIDSTNIILPAGIDLLNFSPAEIQLQTI